MSHLIVHPFPYCIPDENIVDYNDIKYKKHIIISDIIPGEKLTYRFGCDDEKEYNEHYQESLFAFTSKKGGWDCLRHYEILANGCLPIVKNLGQCPKDTLFTLPKKMIEEYSNLLLPYKKEYRPIYDEYICKILNHVRNNCSTSSSIQYFLEKMNHIKNIKNVLLIRCDEGVNYTREFFWIGMKRYIQSILGVAVEYPKIDYLYESYSGNKKLLHGFGFNYACKLVDDYNLGKEEIIDKINYGFWDLIVYGKVGPDELWEGSIPNLPLWNQVNQKYTKEQIVFLYGGDECIDLTYNNKYSQHISYHGQFGHCFVRELKR
jgi:hypothetical protein